MSAIDKIAGSTFAGGGFHGRSSTHECTIRFDRFVMLPGAWSARNPTRCQERLRSAPVKSCECIKILSPDAFSVDRPSEARSMAGRGVTLPPNNGAFLHTRTCWPHVGVQRSALVVFLVVAAMVLACSGGEQPPPIPTPAPIAVPGTVDLDTDVRLVDMFGNHAVGYDRDGEWWFVDVRTGKSTQFTDDGYPKLEVALTADYVAWVDQRRQILLPGYPTRVLSGDVFVRNRHTGEERRITDTPATRKGLRASGSHLVWQDNRKGLLEGRRRDFDIYDYDLEEDVEIPIVVTPGQQETPAIHGDMVVWSDNRNRPEDAPSRAGCSACPDNPFDIYLYNLKTAEERPLTQTGGYNGRPSIHGHRVTWQQFQERDESVVVLLDLETGEQTFIGDAGRGGSSPLISEDYVVWAVAEPCDMFTIPPGKAQNGVYAYGLKTGEVRQLSDYVEPVVMLHANVALIAEVCFGVRRQYAVHLD